MHAIPRKAASLPDTLEQAPGWRHSVSRLTRRLRGGNDLPVDRDTADGDIGDHDADIDMTGITPPRLPHMAEVADYLRERQLAPLPVHYEMAWTALGGPVSQPAVPPPAAGELCADALDRLIADAQGTLDDMSSVLSQSRAEATAYGSALAQEAAALSPSPGAFDMLMALTRTMIERTREADQRMREMGDEMDQLHGHLSEARTTATRDPLTGLKNRRAIEAKLDDAIAGAEVALPTDAAALVLGYCDIDHFKAINDRLGHEVGDRVLKLVARILDEGVGNSGRVSRYGGEEFLLFFDGLSLDEAEERVDAVRRDLAARVLRVRDTDEPIGKVTFSAGLSTWMPGDGREALIRRADHALYRAKALGRNRIERG